MSSGNEDITAWTQNLLSETVETDMARNAVSLPSVGASGGILIVASERFFRVQQTYYQTANTITASIIMLAENKEWSLTGVYGPQSDADKILFVQDLSDLRQHVLPAWLMLGDFNLILCAQDKNNSRLNVAMLNRFRFTIDNLELARIDLRGKKYT